MKSSCQLPIADCGSKKQWQVADGRWQIKNIAGCLLLVEKEFIILKTKHKVRIVNLKANTIYGLKFLVKKNFNLECIFYIII